MDEYSHPTHALARPRRRWVTVLAWTLAGGCAMLSVLWTLAGESYTLDLIANLGAQCMMVCLLMTIAVAATRRRLALLVATVACVLQALPLVQHRAAFWPRPIDGERARAPDEVRFLHYNDSSQSDKSQVYELLARSEADVISVIAPPVQMQFDVIYGKGLEKEYVGKIVREWRVGPDGVSTDRSAGFIVSHWPLTPADCSFVGPDADKFLAAIVRRPDDRGGPFAVVGVHPRSPRNVQRWFEGNATVQALVVLASKLRSDGLPVVVLTDLNSTPTGWRSRLACSEGILRRAKPLLACTGTYPDVVPLNIRTRASTGLPAFWPARIAIDDALVSPEVEVTGWRIGTVRPMRGLKSEHDPVLIELRIPRAAASEANPNRR